MWYLVLLVTFEGREKDTEQRRMSPCQAFERRHEVTVRSSHVLSDLLKPPCFGKLPWCLIRGKHLFIPQQPITYCSRVKTPNALHCTTLLKEKVRRDNLQAFGNGKFWKRMPAQIAEARQNLPITAAGSNSQRWYWRRDVTAYRTNKSCPSTGQSMSIEYCQRVQDRDFLSVQGQCCVVPLISESCTRTGLISVSKFVWSTC